MIRFTTDDLTYKQASDIAKANKYSRCFLHEVKKQYGKYDDGRKRYLYRFEVVRYAICGEEDLLVNSDYCVSVDENDLIEVK